jgi:putative transposase
MAWSPDARQDSNSGSRRPKRSAEVLELQTAERGVMLTYEAVRYWCWTFGQAYANQWCRRRPRPGDTWYLDEVFLTIQGERHYLWHAVDQDGKVLDIRVQSRWHQQAAKKFFRKLLKGLTYVPRVLITDKLNSYGAAKPEIRRGVEHRQHRYLNNRAENAHQPTRQRKRRMGRFTSAGHDQRVLAAYARSHRTSARGVTGSRLPHTVRRCGNASTFGRRSQARP